MRHSLAFGGHHVLRVADKELLIRGGIKERKDLTLAELCERLGEHEVSIKLSALWHQLDKWKLTFKKTLHTSEQARHDVAKARAEWKENQPALDVTKLVFLDKTGAGTQMTRSRGRAPISERCVASVPHGHGKTTPFSAVLWVSEVTTPRVLDDPMDSYAFLVYVREFLCPTLKSGDIVIADNLSSYKVAGVREAIEARGTFPLYRYWHWYSAASFLGWFFIAHSKSRFCLII